MPRTILIICILIFICWISLFGEPLQEKYSDFRFLGITCFFVIALFYKLPEKFSVIDIVFFLHFFVLTLTLNFAENRPAAIYHYALYILPIPLLYLVLRSIDKSFIFPIAGSIVFFSSLVVFIGFLELLFHKNIIYEIWVDNFFYQRFIHKTPRMMSTLIHPTVFGSFLLGCIPLTFFLSSQLKKPFRIFIKLLIPFFVLGIIFSFSRGNLVGLVGIIFIYLSLIKKLRYLKFLFIGLILLVVLSSTILSYKTNLSRFSWSGLSNAWWRSKGNNIKITWEILKDHPFIGIGLNQYRWAFDRYKTDFFKQLEIESTGGKDALTEWRIPDNMYLSILAESGILGFSTFIFFLILLFKSALTRISKITEKAGKEFLIASLCGVIGLLISMNTYDLFYWSNPLLLFWFLVGTMRGIELYL